MEQCYLSLEEEELSRGRLGSLPQAVRWITPCVVLLLLVLLLLLLLVLLCDPLTAPPLSPPAPGLPLLAIPVTRDSELLFRRINLLL